MRARKSFEKSITLILSMVEGVSRSGLGPFSYQRLHFGDGLKQLVLITHDLSSFARDTKYLT